MNKIKLAINSLITFFIYLVGGIDKVFICLAILMLIDYITGIFKAIAKKDVNSQRGISGIFYKISIIFMIVIANQVDIITNQNVFRDLICYFFISNEGISIIENLTQLGLPIPSKITKFFEQLNNKGDD